MQVRIHRGAKEIGGSCIEVTASGKRIVLDVGRPLDAEFGETLPLPNVPGLAQGGDPSLLALLISHGHQDHWGLFGQIHESVPVYVGEGAAAILKAAEFFSPAGVDLRPTGHLEHREPFELGPFRITPFLNDHNGFDAYSMLIEADGRKLFYSGDFQGHGRKKDIFSQMLRKPPRDVDVMLMEGTNVRTETEIGQNTTEDDVEEELVEVFDKTSGMVLVSYSAQSIDRMVTIYRACKRAGRTFVVDLYTATMGVATGRDAIPKPGFPNLEVFVPKTQQVKVAKAKEFERVNSLDKKHRIFPEAFAPRSGELTMTFRMSYAWQLEEARCLDQASAVWSMWPGYLERPGERRYQEFLRKNAIPHHVIHASGHAYLSDLKKFADTINPKRLVPIHSFAPGRFQEHFENVEPRADGEWWEV